MKWFLDLSTRGKLIAGFGTMLVFMAAVMISAYLGIVSIRQSQQNLYQQDFANAEDLMRLRAEENGVRAAVLDMMLVTRRSEQEAWHRDIRERSKEIVGLAESSRRKRVENVHRNGEAGNGLRSGFALPSSMRDPVILLS